jgi:hypothetical protein
VKREILTTAEQVGILARAKRRKILQYDSGFGDLLLQGTHDRVKIILVASLAESWRRTREGKKEEPRMLQLADGVQPALLEDVNKQEGN